MKTVALGLCLAAIGLAGTALAEQTMTPGLGERTVTRADALARAAQMFDRLDVNKDGKLDPADREAMRVAAFDRIDTNKDGQISRAEFLAVRPGMGNDHMGGNHMGGDHMRGHRMGGSGMGDHGMGGMMLMRMADSNHDGAVSKDEFMAAAATRFDAADTNHDAVLTPAERQAAHQAMRERMRGMMQHRMNGDVAMPPAPPPVN